MTLKIIPEGVSVFSNEVRVRLGVIAAAVILVCLLFAAPAAAAGTVEAGSFQELNDHIGNLANDDLTIIITNDINVRYNSEIMSINRKNITLIPDDTDRRIFWTLEGDEKPASPMFRLSGGNLTIRGNASGSTLTLDGGAVFSGDFWGYPLVDVENSSTFTLNNGGILTNNNAASGGGMYLTHSTFEMSGGEISGNTATGNGGGVLAAGMIAMNSGAITNNTANIDGGGVYVYDTFTLTAGTIAGNTANYGGEVYVSTTGTFKESGTASVGPYTTHLTTGTVINVTHPLTDNGGAKNITVEDVDAVPGTVVVQLPAAQRQRIWTVSP
jgi:hypothetical protein